jgi:raffinose/stachyose/melibiose transport system substrate-binding protein
MRISYKVKLENKRNNHKGGLSMNKKLLATLLAATMSVGLLAGCGGSSSDDGSTTTGTDSSTDSSSSAATTTASADAIRLVNGKIEIDDTLKELAAQYQAETGQEIVIESLGGGVDIQGQLKGYYQAGNMPDIFVIGGEGDYKNWDGLCADLGDCAFAADTDMAFKDSNGTVVGFPYAVEGYGITYNADILEAAGVDPTTLTSYSAYEAAFAKIDSMKDELGITAVCSVAAEAGQMYWSTGNHLFGYYLSGGLDRDDKTYYDELMNGEIDEARMTQFCKFFDLLCQYSDQQVLISGTYDDQLALWAQGKTAFITQGNWIDASLADYDVTFNCAIAPLAFTDEEMDGVLADCPSWWCVYGDGKNVDGAKAFLDWLATTEEGQKGLVTDCGMVSPYNSCEITPDFPLATSLSGFIADGKTYAWDWSNMPEGIAQNYTGYVFDSYAKGEIDSAGFVSMMASQVASCIAESK